MKKVQQLQILNSVKHSKRKEESKKVAPMLHMLNHLEPQKPIRHEEDTDKLIAESGLIKPLGICFNCD